MNTITKTSSRKYYLDFLKAIGLFGIIFAHVEPPGLIMMARSFDVPLMVLISAILANQSFAKKDLNVITYFISRIKRLVIPTWIFLSFYFIVQAIFNNTYSIKYYINSFLLTRYGIGYVWIVLIYLYCALVIPLFHYTKNKKILFSLTVVVYIIYEFAYFYNIGTDNKFLMSTVYYIIPYATLTAIGFHYDSMSKKLKIFICTVSFATFISIAIYLYIKTGELVSVSHYKYPPVLYYIAYALFCSFFLLLICDKKENKLFKNKLIVFISSHSFWIYLWHIFYLTLYKYFCQDIYNLNFWILKFIIILTTSTLTVWVQNKIVDICERKNQKLNLKFLRG